MKKALCLFKLALFTYLNFVLVEKALKQLHRLSVEQLAHRPLNSGKFETKQLEQLPQLCIPLERGVYYLDCCSTYGQFYPSSTLHQLLCGLLCDMRQENPYTLNLLDKNDTQFKSLHSTCNSQLL